MKKRNIYKVSFGLLTLLLLLLHAGCSKDDEEDVTLPATDIDGNVYNTIKIGKQIWFAQNLKTTRYNDGTPILYVPAKNEWAALKTGGYCWYDNNITYKETFGALYNWNTVASDKLCPAGWHVPSDEEWNILAESLGGEGVAGGKLKSTDKAYWKEPNTGASDKLKYTALPGGCRIFDGSFYNIYLRGIWWSSTESLENVSITRELDYEYRALLRRSFDKTGGVSVRCIKDQP